MNLIEKYLYKIGVLQISPKKVDKWIQNTDIQRLEFGLENGMHDIRLKCIDGLCVLPHDVLLQKLLPYIDDPIHVVSALTMHILVEITLDQDILNKIESKKRFWAVQVQKSSSVYKKDLSFENSPFRKPFKEIPSDKALKTLKEQLDNNRIF